MAVLGRATAQTNTMSCLYYSWKRGPMLSSRHHFESLEIHVAAHVADSYVTYVHLAVVSARARMDAIFDIVSAHGAECAAIACERDPLDVMFDNVAALERSLKFNRGDQLEKARIVRSKNCERRRELKTASAKAKGQCQQLNEERAVRENELTLLEAPGKLAAHLDVTKPSV